MPDPVKNVLLIGTSTNVRIFEALNHAGQCWPDACFTVCCPMDREIPKSGKKISWINIPIENISRHVIASRSDCDAVVLVLAHTGRANYPALVQLCINLSPQCFLFSATGWQRLDARDTESAWPAEIPELPARTVPRQARAWVFFRPSDQTARHIAVRLRAKGAVVTEVETLAELEAVLPEIEAVFFDWCITHYNALFKAISLAMRHPVRIEALISLDLADITENSHTAAKIIHLNKSAFRVVDHIHYLASRKFILERYALDFKMATPWWNQVNRNVWTNQAKKSPCGGNDKPLRLIYHGLFYYWHEVSEFLPVLKVLQARIPLRFDLFGRVHESLSINGTSLFPERERQVHKALNEMAKLPGVTFHPFTRSENIVQVMTESDYYVGITAGKSLMSRTEIRTGEEEAVSVGIPLLRKQTLATELRGWQPGRDFFAIDSLQPEKAAEEIIRVNQSNGRLQS